MVRLDRLMPWHSSFPSLGEKGHGEGLHVYQPLPIASVSAILMNKQVGLVSGAGMHEAPTQTVQASI